MGDNNNNVNMEKIVTKLDTYSSVINTLQLACLILIVIKLMQGVK